MGLKVIFIEKYNSNNGNITFNVVKNVLTSVDELSELENLHSADTGLPMLNKFGEL